jgi:ACR3 family arsenite efflux pump ArsB
MGGYFRIMTAIPGFFLSALLLMLFWNANIDKLFTNVQHINYPMSMFMTLIIWLVVAPLAAGGFGRRWGHRP